MGSVCSVNQYKLLIGELSNLPNRDRKLFQLSKFVIENTDPVVGKIDQTLGIKVLDTDTFSYQGSIECSSNNQSKKDESVSCNDVHIATNQNLNVISTFSFDLHNGDVKSLFYILLTDRPYYYSQTFSQWENLLRYSSLCPPICCQRDKEVIYLLPVDNFPDFINNYLIHLESYADTYNFFSLIKTFLEAFFDGYEVTLLHGVNVVQCNWKIKTRLHHVTQKKQNYIGDFHKCLRKVIPRDAFCLVGITWTDFYPSDKLNFVLGEANFFSRTAGVCFGRYEPKTYDPSTHQDITQLDWKIMWRLLKVLSHEICHLFGLQHCWYFQCAMNESNSMNMAASQPLFLCPVCLRKLQHTMQFDILSRYKKLLRFFVDLYEKYPASVFKHSVIWLEQCIVFIESNEDSSLVS
ncbi:hypothetical protein ACF0H5_016093 [Mactra antiquata]